MMNYTNLCYKKNLIPLLDKSNINLKILNKFIITSNKIFTSEIKKYYFFEKYLNNHLLYNNYNVIFESCFLYYVHNIYFKRPFFTIWGGYANRWVIIALIIYLWLFIYKKDLKMSNIMSLRNIMSKENRKLLKIWNK